MEFLRKKPVSRMLSLLLVLIFILVPSAQALSLEQARDLLTQYYVDEIPDDVLSQATVEDMILALNDPYTQYMNPEEYQAFSATMQDEVVVGIGVSLAQDDAGLLVMGTFSDSSAEEAGLTAGDLILTVDGQSTVGVNYEVSAGWIRGEEGTQTTVEVRHADGSVQSYTLTRRPVVIAATTSQMLNEDTCYIVCDTFGSETLGHFQEGLDSYSSQTTQWIIDLRANLGGDVAAASNTLGLFLGQGPIVCLRDGEGNYSWYISPQDSKTMYPVIVLTSPWTASASEIFCGAVRDYQDGLIIGSRTFGKGVAQVILNQETAPDYFDDGSAMKITAFRYFSVDGNTADKIGIIPHLLVSDKNAANVALLLSTVDPLADNQTSLRMHLGAWRWYVDLDAAVSDELRPAFIELLEALSPEAELFLGQGDGQWSETTPGEVAALEGLSIAPRTFTDAADSVYQTEIDTLHTYEIVRGCDDGLFHPDRTMTRAELCALLAQAMNLSPSSGENSVFTDVPVNAWYAPWVTAMHDLGLVEGSGDGQFHPEDTIDHEQLITVMARLAVWLNLNFYEAEKNRDQTVLTDPVLDGYSDWAKDGVWLLGKSQTNLLGGEVNLLFAPVDQLDPGAPTLREEAAALIYSILTTTGVLTF